LWLSEKKAIWATKDTKSGETASDIIVKTTIKELVIYMIFLAVITTSKSHNRKKILIKLNKWLLYFDFAKSPSP
jgi:hypothetical protein